MKNLTLNLKKPDIAWVEWEQPDSPVNLLNASFMEDLALCLSQLQQLKPKALVWTSKRPNVFCAGADIKSLQKIKNRQEMQQALSQAKELFNRFEQLPFPSIAVIQGICYGGGLEWALRFDCRLAGDKARFSLPEVKLGLIPGLGGNFKLPRLIGLPSALKMILTGQSINSRKALRWGLVDERVPSLVLEKRALQKAQELAQGQKETTQKRYKNRFFPLKEKALGPLWLFLAKKKVLKKTKGLYPAPLKALELIQKTQSGWLSKKGEERETEAFCDLFYSEESKNMVRLFLLMEKAKKSLSTQRDASSQNQQEEREKQDPNKTVSPSFLKGPEAGETMRAATVSSAPLAESKGIERVGIVGAGLMGRSLAWLFADKGFKTRLIDIQEESLCSALDWAEKLWEKKKQKGIINFYELRQKKDSLSVGLDFQGFSTLDLVIEALPEEESLKKKVIADISKRMSARAFFASNSSSLSIQSLAQASQYPKNFFGLHFFNPAHIMPLVEICLSETQKEQSMDSLGSALKKIKKIPLWVKDSPGFVVNRLLAALLAEALFLFEEGHNIESMDSFLRDKMGFPLGPFELMDKIGLDICTKTMTHLKLAGLNVESPKWIDRICEILGQGEKSQQGFYIYSDKNKKEMNEKTRELQRVNQPLCSEEDVRQRLLHRVLHEAQGLIRDGVVASGEDIDLALAGGMGWPAFSGGPMRWAQSLGLKEIEAQRKKLAERYGSRFS